MDAPPPVEKRIALDLARHGLLVAPVVVIAAGLFGGVDAAASAALGLGVCVLNFFAAAVSLEWGARRGGNALMAVALGGFLFRMLSIVLVIVVARALFGWVDVLVLGLTLFVAHLGLLFWELRSVSFSLAAPGLRRDQLTTSARKDDAQ